MSGLSGHMLNLWEDLSLTKADLKEIIQRSFENRFCFKEKIDGFNIHFFIKDGELRFARNKKDLLNGGMDLDGICNRWFNKKDIFDVYKDAYMILSDTLFTFQRGLPAYTPKFKNSIVTYNCECFKAGITNVVPYEFGGVAIHNIWEWDLDSNEVIITDFNDVNKGYFQFLCDPYVYIELKDSYKSLYKYYNDTIDSIFGQCKTIEELYQREFLIYLKKDFAHAFKHPEYIKYIFNRIFKDDNSFNLRDLKKIYKDPEEFCTENIIKTLIDLKQDVKYTCYGELRKTLIEIGDVLLRDADCYINQIYKYKAQDILRKEINDAIDRLIKCGNQHTINIASKIYHEYVTGGSTINPLEGVVFNYNNQTYKWTGSFSIINKIIGLSKSYDKKI